MDGRLDIDEILDEMPFSGRQEQSERLADFFVANCSGNQEHVREKTGISQPTIRRIKDSFQDLDAREKAVLIDHVSNVLYSRALSDN